MKALEKLRNKWRNKREDILLFIGIIGPLSTVAIMTLLSYETTIGIIIYEGFGLLIVALTFLIAGILGKQKLREKGAKLYIAILIPLFYVGIYTGSNALFDIVQGPEITTFGIEKKEQMSNIGSEHSWMYDKYYIYCSPVYPIEGGNLKGVNKFRAVKENYEKLKDGQEYILTYYPRIRVITEVAGG